MSTPKFGLTLSSEEHDPARLVELAVAAESKGFDFVSISDHFHPWLDAQGHSPNVWPVLGAIAASTSTIEIAVGVTCPIMRIHPAILAHLAATTARLCDGRFTWGVGSGEALNEHILGDRWPPAPQRVDMLREAVDVIRSLWTGDTVTYAGEYFRVEHARLYDLPDHPVPIIVSAFGDLAAEVAADVGDGLWITGTEGPIERWARSGGTGPVYSQLSFCWADDADVALDTVAEVWPNTAVPGQLSQDLPTPQHFEQASSIVTREMLAEQVVHGPDLDPLVEQVGQAIRAGVDHVYFHQIGPDQDGFLAVWEDQLAARVRGVADAASVDESVGVE